jgi:hypothetical protein
MKYTITPATLTLEADEAERAELRAAMDERPEHFGTLDHEAEFMESLIANSELEWINPEDTGDLTGAPMLGIYGPECQESELPADRIGALECGRDSFRGFYQPILQRWAFMDYAIRSFLADLMNTGKAVFIA